MIVYIENHSEFISVGNNLPAEHDILNACDTWCHRVLDIKDPEKKITNAKKTATVLVYFDEKVEPYFSQKVVKYFKKQMIIYIENIYKIKIFCQLTDCLQ